MFNEIAICFGEAVKENLCSYAIQRKMIQELTRKLQCTLNVKHRLKFLAEEPFATIGIASLFMKDLAETALGK